MKKGIMVAGSILVDKINEISAFPKAGELTQILSTDMAVGGCVPNVAVDLKVIDGTVPVYACGKTGADEEGSFVRNELGKYGVITDDISVSPSDKTSFTDVMSVRGGERTFFTFAGASALFGKKDVNLDRNDIGMLHLGYFLLLKKVDEVDGLEILKAAKGKGIKTSIDLVSENSDRYSLILPCLRYVDNLIVNEIEAGKLAGIAATRGNLREICEKLKKAGVRERVIIHMPDLSVCLSERGYAELASFDLPENYIKGSTGAGDAFCAGALCGIYRGVSDAEILNLASCCAAVSLRAPDAVSGMMSAEKAIDFCSRFKRKNV